MNKIKYYVLVLFFSFVLVLPVNAETIGVKRIGETREFNVVVNDVKNSDTINVIEGTLSFNKNYIEKIDVTANGKWKIKTLVKDGSIKFVSYLIGDFADSGDDLFKIKVVLYKGVDLTKEELLITDLITNNGKDLFKFDDLRFKYDELQGGQEVVTQSNPSSIGKEDLSLNIPSIDKDDNQYSVPDMEYVNAIKENESKNNGVIAIVICVLCLIISIVINTLIHLRTSQLLIANKEKEMNLNDIEVEVRKTKRRGRKKTSSKKGDN